MKKIITFTLALVMLFSLLAVTVLADTPPATIKAPKNIGTSFYFGPHVLVNTISAQDDLLALLAKGNTARGYTMSVNAQVDFKIDGGNWHYSSAWDSPDTYRDYAAGYYNVFNDDEMASYDRFAGSDRLYIYSMFPNEESNVSDDAEWLKSHTITTRARFAVTFDEGTPVFSGWSETADLSANSIMDYKKILNENKPALVSSGMEISGIDQKPYMVLNLQEPSDALQKLNAASGDAMRAEVYVRLKDETDFSKVDDLAFNCKKLTIDPGIFFNNTTTDYAAAQYEVKVRYYFDAGAYYIANDESAYYTGYSNTLSQGMPAWSNASAWATGELKKANDMGLIPDTLKNADMTKPITRAEFAAVSVKAYENLSGEKATPAASNPFIDTKDTEVLKAYNTGIAVGVSSNQFDPNKILNREQAATMLTRVIKKISIPGWAIQTDGNYKLTYTQPAKFADDAQISDWAKDSVYFMAANGIISGVGNNTFAPKNTTSAEEAVGYASATREQAIVIAARMVENLKGKALDYSAAATQSTQPTPAPAQPSQNTSLVGVWSSGPETPISNSTHELKVKSSS